MVALTPGRTGQRAVVVSVIMIFRDAGDFIAEAVESVRAQTCTDWELLLVDDGSTDASAGIADEYARRWPDRIRLLTPSRRRESRDERIAKSRTRRRLRPVCRIPGRGRCLPSGPVAAACRDSRSHARHRHGAERAGALVQLAAPRIAPERGLRPAVPALGRPPAWAAGRLVARVGRAPLQRRHLQHYRAAGQVARPRRFRAGISRGVRGPGGPGQALSARDDVRVAGASCTLPAPSGIVDATGQGAGRRRRVGRLGAAGLSCMAGGLRGSVRRAGRRSRGTAATLARASGRTAPRDRGDAARGLGGRPEANRAARPAAGRASGRAALASRTRIS